MVGIDNVKYTGTLSSGGKQSTTQANQVITLTNSSKPAGYTVTATYVIIDAFATPLHVQLNSESTVHEIDASTSMSFQDIEITKFMIQENAAQYRWRAFY